MKKFDNFCKSLKNLNDIHNYNPPYDNVILSGLVALYEICFEQSWKAMKEILEQDGLESVATGSPRQILKLAYKTGMIEDQDLWLSALASRNNASHAYNQAVALDIIADTKNKYHQMFCDLKTKLENWE